MKIAAVPTTPEDLAAARARMAAVEKRQESKARECPRCHAAVHKGRCKGSKNAAKVRGADLARRGPAPDRRKVYEAALALLESERDDIEAAIDGLRRLLGRST